MNIIIGNTIALIASFLMVYTGVLKKKKIIIFIQSIQIGLMAISNLVLGGITGAIINAISLVRNILCYKNKFNKKVKVTLIFISTILSILLNNLGLIGLLPLLSTIVYTWLMDIEDIIKFKYLVIFTFILWFIYDLYIMSYISSLFDFISIISNLIAIIQLSKIKNIKIKK